MESNAPPFAGPPVTPAFSLIDHHGRRVSELTYRGKHLIVYFGFTHCRVVCPRTLSQLTQVLAGLGEAALNIVPLYISVDPERDTPEVMRAFLQQYPRFIGLTGSRAETDSAKSEFRVFATRRADADDLDGYAVPHTASSYVIGPNGDYLTYFPTGLDTEALVIRLKAQLTASGETSC